MEILLPIFYPFGVLTCMTIPSKSWLILKLLVYLWGQETQKSRNEPIPKGSLVHSVTVSLKDGDIENFDLN